MPNQVIDGRAVAAAMLEGVLSDVDALRQDGWIPQLVSIRIGDSPGQRHENLPGDRGRSHE